MYSKTCGGAVAPESTPTYQNSFLWRQFRSFAALFGHIGFVMIGLSVAAVCLIGLCLVCFLFLPVYSAALFYLRRRSGLFSGFHRS